MGVKTEGKNVSEVAFRHHVVEFVRFYERQRVFCNEISGLRERVVLEEGVEKKFRIGASNFAFAIRRLNAFVISHIHYIRDLTDRTDMKEKVKSLENQFLSDRRYWELNSFSTRSDEQEIELQRRYFHYLKQCFEISNELCMHLQSSLMISTRDVKKHIEWFNDVQFYEQLSKYRDEIDDDLSNFKVKYVYDHFKRMLGYYFTYRILVDQESRDQIDSLIEKLYMYLLTPDFSKFLKTIRSKDSYAAQVLEDVKEESSRVIDVYNTIYNKTNESLGEKNILPKIQQKIHVDKTTI